MSRTLAATTGLLIALPLVAVLPAQAADGPPPGQPRVVTDRLDNPRQLDWNEGRNRLLVAEAGRGGTSCFGEGEDQRCAGLTGRITEVSRPHTDRAAARTAVRGLLSIAGPSGSFALGSAGADGTDVGGQYIAVVSDVPPDQLPEGAEAVPGVDQLGHLVVAGREDGEPFVLPYADIAAAEQAQNPDTAQKESNPYATVFVDPTPGGPEGADGYALVADAAANTVWKVQPRFAEAPPDAPPPYDITVFATYPTTALPNGEDDPEGPPEFVPTSLALDHAGHVFVGGLGSDVQGAAQVVQYDLTGEEVRRWTGFTGVTGVAVGARHLYVSQIFGSVPPAPPGNTPDDEAPETPQAVPGSVVRTSLSSTQDRRHEVDVPFPAGLATDRRGNVFAAVNSIAPAEGARDVFGPNSFDVGGGAVWQLDFTGAREMPPTTTPEPTESPEPTDPPGPEDPEGPPADTDGRFVAVEAAYYEPHSGRACGTTVTLSSGDVREVEYRSTHAADGTVTVDYRGRFTVDVTRESDGAKLDELDISGPGSEVFAGSAGTFTVTVSLDGPSIILPSDDAEAGAFGAAGLPYFSFFEGGTLTFEVDLESSTPDAEPTTASVTVTENTTTGVHDVCQMLDATKPGGSAT